MSTPQTLHTVVPLKFNSMLAGSQEKVVQLDSRKLTKDKLMTLIPFIGELRKKTTGMDEEVYPFETDPSTGEKESLDAWEKRVGEIIRLKKRERLVVDGSPESDSALITRLLSPEPETFDFYFELLNKWCKITGQSPLTEDDFREVNIPGIANHLYTYFCSRGDLPIQELYPKS